jgi:hypothetical protein
MMDMGLLMLQVDQEERQAKLEARLAKIDKETAPLKVIARQKKLNQELRSFSTSTLKEVLTVVAGKDESSESAQVLLLTQVVDSYVHRCEKYIGDDNTDVSQWFNTAKKTLLALREMEHFQGNLEMDSIHSIKYGLMINAIIHKIREIESSLL